MKVGILGTGFGAYHASIYKELNNVEVVRVFGRNKEKLNKIKADLGFETTTSIDDIILDEDIDIVDVCLPSSLHREYVIKALKSGKDVLCETPVALSLEDALAIKEVENKYSKRVFVDLFIKFEFPYVYLYDTIASNKYGKLKALHMKRKTSSIWGDLSLNIISTKLMIHELDFITWALGQPKTVFARGVSGKEGQSHVNVNMSYEDSIVEIQCSSMMPDHYPFAVGYEAIFEEGTIEFFENDYYNKNEKALVVFTKEGRKEIEIPDENCFKKSLQHAIDCCESGRESIIGINEAIKSLEVALQVQKIISKE